MFYQPKLTCLVVAFQQKMSNFCLSKTMQASQQQQENVSQSTFLVDVIQLLHKYVTKQLKILNQQNICTNLKSVYMVLRRLIDQHSIIQHSIPRCSINFRSTTLAVQHWIISDFLFTGSISQLVLGCVLIISFQYFFFL